MARHNAVHHMLQWLHKPELADVAATFQAPISQEVNNTSSPRCRKSLRHLHQSFHTGDARGGSADQVHTVAVSVSPLQARPSCAVVFPQGIITALREKSEALKAAKVQIFVRR